MKRDEADSSSCAEQMVCTQLRKNGLYDVGYSEKEEEGNRGKEKDFIIKLPNSCTIQLTRFDPWYIQAASIRGASSRDIG